MKSLFAFVLLAGIIAAVMAEDKGQPPDFHCTEDGYFADHHRNCQVYYKCEGEAKATFGCETGTRFDVNILKCIPSEEVPCPYPSE